MTDRMRNRGGWTVVAILIFGLGFKGVAQKIGVDHIAILWIVRGEDRISHNPGRSLLLGATSFLDTSAVSEGRPLLSLLTADPLDAARDAVDSALYQFAVALCKGKR